MNRIKYLAIVVATACITSCNMLAEDYKEYLKEHISLELTFNAIDCFNNQTTNYSLTIKVIDTVINLGRKYYVC